MTFDPNPKSYEELKADSDLFAKEERVCSFAARMLIDVITNAKVRVLTDNVESAYHYLDVIDAALTDAWYVICGADKKPKAEDE